MTGVYDLLIYNKFSPVRLINKHKDLYKPSKNEKHNIYYQKDGHIHFGYFLDGNNDFIVNYPRKIFYN
jgi:hypothetical protein